MYNRNRYSGSGLGGGSQGQLGGGLGQTRSLGAGSQLGNGGGGLSGGLGAGRSTLGTSQMNNGGGLNRGVSGGLSGGGLSGGGLSRGGLGGGLTGNGGSGLGGGGDRRIQLGGPRGTTGGLNSGGGGLGSGGGLGNRMTGQVGLQQMGTGLGTGGNRLGNQSNVNQGGNLGGSTLGGGLGGRTGLGGGTNQIQGGGVLGGGQRLGLQSGGSPIAGRGLGGGGLNRGQSTTLPQGNRMLGGAGNYSQGGLGAGVGLGGRSLGQGNTANGLGARGLGQGNTGGGLSGRGLGQSNTGSGLARGGGLGNNLNGGNMGLRQPGGLGQGGLNQQGGLRQTGGLGHGGLNQQGGLNQASPGLLRGQVGALPYTPGKQENPKSELGEYILEPFENSIIATEFDMHQGQNMPNDCPQFMAADTQTIRVWKYILEPQNYNSQKVGEYFQSGGNPDLNTLRDCLPDWRTELANELIFTDGVIFCACWYNDSKSIIFGSDNGLVYFWNSTTQEQATPLHQHTSRVLHCFLYLNNNAALIVSSDEAGEIHVWDPTNPSQVMWQTKLPAVSDCMDVSSAFGKIIAAYGGEEVQQQQQHRQPYGLNQQKQQQPPQRGVFIADLNLSQEDYLEPPISEHRAECIQIMPDGRGYAVGSDSGRVAIEYFNDNLGPLPKPKLEKEVKNFAYKCHREKISSNEEKAYCVTNISFRPVSKNDQYPYDWNNHLSDVFTTCGSDGKLIFWDKYLKKFLREIPSILNNCPIYKTTFSPDGGVLAIVRGQDYTDPNNYNKWTNVKNFITLHCVRWDECHPKAQKDNGR